MIKTLNILITRSLYIYIVPRQRPIPKTEDRAVAAANNGLDAKSAALLVLEKGYSNCSSGEFEEAKRELIERAAVEWRAGADRGHAPRTSQTPSVRTSCLEEVHSRPALPLRGDYMKRRLTVGAETRGEKREVDRIKMQRELWTDACNAESARFRLVNEARREGLENTFGFITVALTKTLQERVMNYDVGAFGAELQGR